VTKAKLLKTKYLIIGNSAGGIGAVEAIREVDNVGAIAIVSDEPYLSYSRPLISKYLSKERTFKNMLFRPLDFYTRNNINAMLGKKVKSLELSEHAAELESNEHIVWDKLLIATGGKPIVPKMGGAGKRGVFTFTTLNDARSIDEFIESASKAVVIGGGLIGISVTEALKKRGVKVTVVEMKGKILNTILDEQASTMIEKVLEQAGVGVITGSTVAEITGNELVKGVILDNGEEILCNMVVVAIGVLPRTELVLGTEIKVNRGIVVDRHMATTYPDVYACGDVAEAYDFVYGANRLTPIWPNAYIGGRVAGFNMAGANSEYPGSTAMNSLNYFGLDIASAGIAIPPDSDGYELISKERNGAYQKIVLKDDVIAGMVFVGNIEKSGIVYSLMRDRVEVGSFKRTLLSDNFGLVSLPREIWQKRLCQDTALAGGLKNDRPG
jgi:NAD(P)H-nitrite reductase large subunit